MQLPMNSYYLFVGYYFNCRNRIKELFTVTGSHIMAYRTALLL